MATHSLIKYHPVVPNLKYLANLVGRLQNHRRIGLEQSFSETLVIVARAGSLEGLGITVRCGTRRGDATVLVETLLLTLSALLTAGEAPIGGAEP